MAFAVFRATSQSVLHYQDSGFVLHQAHVQDARHPWHLLVLHPFVLMREWLATYGVSTWAACKATVALGGAVLVAASHRASVSLGLPRQQSIVVAVL
ncbi:MAG: hypothetical protein Q7T30_02925, partial [Planctomycetota bacterium]|nr:hypothetical protein [Planctomycetota bacterium]